MATKNETVIAAAMEYASYGWRVIPISPKTKHPPLKRWQELATTDEEQIVEWWTEKHKNCGVGVLFGPASGIVDLEIDDAAAEPLLREAFGGEIPPTPTFISKRKRLPHRIFAYRDDLPGKANLNLREHGLNVPADLKIGYDDKGSQSVFPPSMDGGYEWLPGLSPSEIEPAELPDAFIAWLANSLSAGANARSTNAARKPSARLALYTVDPVQEGSRDTTIYTEGCAMWREQYKLHGIGAFETPDIQVTVFTRLWSLNKAKCKPPLDDSVVREKCESARMFIMSQAVKGDDVTPQLTSWGLEFRDGEWWPGEWRVDVIRSDPRRMRIWAPILPDRYIEIPLLDFDQPTPVHRAFLAATGTVCLSSKPGFWPGVWNGAKIKDPATGKTRVTTGLKAKLLADATVIDAPLEERREAVIAGRVWDWIAGATPGRTDYFDPSKVRSKAVDPEGNVWFRFNALLAHLAMNEDKITRNELSAFFAGTAHYHELAAHERVRGTAGQVRLMKISRDSIKTLEELATGASHEAGSS